MKKCILACMVAFLVLAVLIVPAGAEAAPETGETAELMDAASGTCGDNLTWTFAFGTLTISGTGKMRDYSSNVSNQVPWFRHRGSLMTVTIESGVTSIGDYAFYRCSMLTSVTIPESVTSIGDNAFRGCKGLTSVTIPEGVTSIGGFAFCGCSKLTSVTIPKGVTSIGDNAFDSFSGLTSVTIGAGVTSIGSSAFLYCSGLTSVTIPDSVTSIGDYAFCGCSKLTSVTIPKGVTSIGSYAFYGCTGLVQLRLPAALADLGANAFRGCTALENVTVPGFVGVVDGVFAECTKLREVRFSNGIAEIGADAFSGCTNLQTVYLPRSVMKIGEKAFHDCNMLCDVYYSGSENDWNAMEVEGYNDILAAANVHFGKNPEGEARADIVGVSAGTADGVRTCTATVYCRADTDALACGGRYDASGRFLELVSVKLIPGEWTELAIPAPDGTFIRVFAVDAATFAPLTPTANISLEEGIPVT